MQGIRLTGSVGIGGQNAKIDIKAVQTALNKLLPLIPPTARLSVDGSLGRNPQQSKTVAAIKLFQQKVVGIIRPDGKIDIGIRGRTYNKLNEKLAALSASPAVVPVISDLHFPLEKVPAESYKIHPRNFGANRSGGIRKHAGCDLKAAKGTAIYAMADGEVVEHKYFYCQTHELVVDHGSFVARYGEVAKELAEGVVKGSKVKKGQHIANIGELKYNSGGTDSMLHLEMYSGKLRGPLTDKTPGHNVYMRRKDIIDPTPYLDKMIAKMG